ncbi:MAG: discoidin domain-containing protein [Luteolibacter sp.]
MVFTADGLIDKVTPTHSGPDFVQRNVTVPDAVLTASSQREALTGPERAADDNYTTRWAAATNANGGWLRLDFKDSLDLTRVEILPEYAWKPYRFAVEVSANGQTWTKIADFTKDPVSGSPITVEKSVRAQHLRIVFPEDVKGRDISLFEVRTFQRR